MATKSPGMHPHDDPGRELGHRLRNSPRRLCPPLLDVVSKLTVAHQLEVTHQLRNLPGRSRAYSAPIFWPCHRVLDVRKALLRPESADTGVLIEFFLNVAGLEFLDYRKRTPAWFAPPPSLVLATVATVRRRSSLLRSLRFFRRRFALSDAELWMGMFIFEASVMLRNEILVVLEAHGIARMCTFCHRLLLSKRKYCSDSCMQAHKDAKRYRRRS
jgi:hypothetical protein